MIQLDLFPVVPAPSGLLCFFGTEWLNHFQPPVGNGLGCIHCATPGASER